MLLGLGTDLTWSCSYGEFTMSDKGIEEAMMHQLGIAPICHLTPGKYFSKRKKRNKESYCLKVAWVKNKALVEGRLVLALLFNWCGWMLGATYF